IAPECACCSARYTDSVDELTSLGDRELTDSRSANVSVATISSDMSPDIVVYESVEPSKPTVKSEITPKRSGSVPVGVLKTPGVSTSGVVTLRISLDLQLAAAIVKPTVMATTRAPAKATLRRAPREKGVCVMAAASVVQVDTKRELSERRRGKVLLVAARVGV